MGKGRFTLLLVAVLLAGCGDHNGDHVQWSGTFQGSETSGTSAGGATVGARGTFLRITGASWVFDLPAPYEDRLPQEDLAAVGQALVFADPGDTVVDAAKTSLGPVALIREPHGALQLALLTTGGTCIAPAPDGATRVVLLGENPLRISVILPDRMAVVATLVVP